MNQNISEELPPVPDKDQDSVDLPKSKNREIKCGNCGYVGPGEKNRSLWAVILAWICIIFAPIITLIYFVVTHTWKCPKCQSTFIGIKNKKDVYVGQLGGGPRFILIIVLIILGLVIFGILSSVVLASLNSARVKSFDEQIKAEMVNLKFHSLVYQDLVGSFDGFCGDLKTVEILKNVSKVGMLNEKNQVCNDSYDGWAVSSPLKSKGYWCVDGTDNSSLFMDKQLNKQTDCSDANMVFSEDEELKLLREPLRDVFINSCIEGSAPKSFCVCVFDNLESNIGLNSMIDLFEKYNTDGVMDEQMLKVAETCSK